MKTLLLMRHAKSSWDDPALSDHDRPLNSRGLKAAKTMAKRLIDSGYKPDLVLVSSALRTQQTAEALQEGYRGTLNLHTESRLYEASAGEYADVIRRVAENVKHLMLIGHNPTVEWMAKALSGRYSTMPTGAYLHLEIPFSWHEFRYETVNIIDYDYPKSGR
jgi:phosphohistidine phosphatase